MALTYTDYVFPGGDAPTYPITFPYLDPSDVRVLINGVPSDAFTFNGDSNTITLDGAPPVDTVTRVYRSTPGLTQDQSTMLVDFQDGSVLSEADLDKANDQLLYCIQESNDSADDGLIVDYDGEFNAFGKRIKNVGTPAADKDAATKNYVDSIAIYGDGFAANAAPQMWEFKGSDFSGVTGDVFVLLLDPPPLATNPDMFIVTLSGVSQIPSKDYFISGDKFVLRMEDGTLGPDEDIEIRNFGTARSVFQPPVVADAPDVPSFSLKEIDDQTSPLLDFQDTSGDSVANVSTDGSATFNNLTLEGDILNPDGSPVTKGLDSLNDVDTAGVADGDSLIYDSSTDQWEAGTPVSDLADLGDVSSDLPQPDDALKWDGNEWVPSASVGDLDDLSNVSTVSPVDGQVLTWSEEDQEWINANPTGGGSIEPVEGYVLLKEHPVELPTADVNGQYNSPTAAIIAKAASPITPASPNSMFYLSGGTSPSLETTTNGCNCTMNMFPDCGTKSIGQTMVGDDTGVFGGGTNDTGAYARTKDSTRTSNMFASGWFTVSSTDPITPYMSYRTTQGEALKKYTGFSIVEYVPITDQVVARVIDGGGGSGGGASAVPLESVYTDIGAINYASNPATWTIDAYTVTSTDHVEGDIIELSGQVGVYVGGSAVTGMYYYAAIVVGCNGASGQKVSGSDRGTLLAADDGAPTTSPSYFNGPTKSTFYIPVNARYVVTADDVGNDLVFNVITAGAEGARLEDTVGAASLTAVRYSSSGGGGDSTTGIPPKDGGTTFGPATNLVPGNEFPAGIAPDGTPMYGMSYTLPLVSDNSVQVWSDVEDGYTTISAQLMHWQIGPMSFSFAAADTCIQGVSGVYSANGFTGATNLLIVRYYSKGAS